MGVELWPTFSKFSMLHTSKYIVPLGMVPLILELTKKRLNINATLFQHTSTAHFACAGYFSFARIISHTPISFIARIEKLVLIDRKRIITDKSTQLLQAHLFWIRKRITIVKKYAVVTSTSVWNNYRDQKFEFDWQHMFLHVAEQLKHNFPTNHCQRKQFFFNLKQSA